MSQTDPFDFKLKPAADDTSTPIGDAIAFLTWVIAGTALAISPAAVWAAWGWFL